MSKPNCQTCGVCCVAPHTQDRFADVSDDDLKRLGRRLIRLHVVATAPIDLLTAAIDGRLRPSAAMTTTMVREKRGPLKSWEACRCSALKGDLMQKVRCAIYEKRPDVCRTAVRPGDRTCRELRRVFKEFLHERA